MNTLVSLLLGETTPSKARSLAEVYSHCPYCVSFSNSDGTVVGLFAIPGDQRWWLEWVVEHPQETLGLQRAEVFFARQVEASSPWSRGEVQAILKQAPCGANCPECTLYRGKCPGCPATQYFLGG